ncbi:restriction endonuclease [Croceiramulus getboli]|nr:restriction endonuclease [Flavobacteriaceae bacterium YJPT1-3]
MKSKTDLIPPIPEAVQKSIQIKKSSGEQVDFSIPKLRGSLLKSGAAKQEVDQIIDTVRDELYQGISTREIYNRAFALLKKKKRVYASKYKLKRAIYELGPTGFPFEQFVGQLYHYAGYEVAVNCELQGQCVKHEVDVVAQKNKHVLYMECKFHREAGRKCDVKVPLYIHSRYQDLIQHPPNVKKQTQGWVVTNTQFTGDAVQYGSCVGLLLLSWDYPKDQGLKDMIDRLGLYPITVSTLLSNREKGFLLSRNVVLCRQLLNDRFYLDHLGISETRIKRILEEVEQLCDVDSTLH